MELSISTINSKIYTIRNEKVMLDSDLSKLYKITTGNLNKAVTRNIERFPGDFMFQLTKEEYENLIFQNGTSSHGGIRKPPRVFTEHGILMLSSVLRSKIAVEVNIKIMRTFVEMRKYALTHEELAKRIESLESRVENGEKVDKQILDVLMEVIHQKDKDEKKIGFL